MKRNVSWLAVTLVAIMALGVVLLAGGRSAVGRAYDLAEYKAADPYYQSLALREQVLGNQRSGVLFWVVGGILAVILVGWFIGQTAPLLKEARLSYKAVRPRRSTSRRAAPEIGHPSTLPTAPTVRMLPEPADYEEAGDDSAVDVWTGAAEDV